MNLYIHETREWRLLIGKAQYYCSFYLPPKLEAFLLVTIYRYCHNSEHSYIETGDCPLTKQALEQVQQLANTAANGMLLAALMSADSTNEDRRVRLLINSSMDAYRKLTLCCPDSEVYEAMYKHYLEVYQIVKYCIEQLDTDKATDYTYKLIAGMNTKPAEQQDIAKSKRLEHAPDERAVLH